MQKQLAELIGVSPHHISEMENNKSVLQGLTRIAKAARDAARTPVLVPIAIELDMEDSKSPEGDGFVS